VQTHIADFLQNTPDGDAARDILGKCVHCGFCTAACPTYKLLGNELDGPRGRIYLIKSVVEGATPTLSTREHLDRCLTCRACEPACPSGVEYGRLADIGRKWVDTQAPRSIPSRAIRRVLREVLTRASLFAVLVTLGRAIRFLLPQSLRATLGTAKVGGAWPKAQHRRKVVMLLGCVQPGLAPNIHQATARVLDALGVRVLTLGGAGCCGAIRHHLSDPDGALVDARRNIDAWWPAIEAGAEAIVTNASGCGAMLREYGHLLRNDPNYRIKAAKIAAVTRDIGEVIAPEADRLRALLRSAGNERIAFHPPCTLQHGQRLSGVVEGLLTLLDAELVHFPESQTCCGSAGTYSLLQPGIAKNLRDRKLEALQLARPDTILSANVGCIAHLRGASGVAVRHWIEWVADRLV
jgi:glycolate oxidase iron-sulfur subunit